MPIYYDSKNRSVSLIKIIASSGEGVIWTTDRKGLIAKIYHQSTPAKISKLQVMIADPPDNPTAAQNHTSLAWPQYLLKKNSGNSNYEGFLMPEVKDARQLIQVYNSQLRNKDASGFNWYVLHATALNLAVAIEAIHARNYVVGDMKPQNILVNQRGLVSIIDTDSFQITDSQNSKVYRCPVGSEGFTPPELIGKDMATVTQTRYHDRFRLAVVIYHLLFGYHPFSGKWNGAGQPPGQDESVSKGYWPYSQNTQLTLGTFQIPLDIVHPETKQSFLKCFNDGHQSPSQRPSAKDWKNTLDKAIKELTTCSKVANHHYSKHTRKCCWCERSSNFGFDAFPNVKNPIPVQPITPPLFTIPTPPPTPRQPVAPLIKPRPTPPPPIPTLPRVPAPVPQEPEWELKAIVAIAATAIISVLGWQGNWFRVQDNICPNLPAETSRSLCIPKLRTF